MHLDNLLAMQCIDKSTLFTSFTIIGNGNKMFLSSFICIGKCKVSNVLGSIGLYTLKRHKTGFLVMVLENFRLDAGGACVILIIGNRKVVMRKHGEMLDGLRIACGNLRYKVKIAALPTVIWNHNVVTSFARTDH